MNLALMDRLEQAGAGVYEAYRRTVSLWQALQDWLAAPEVAARRPPGPVGGGVSGPPVVIRPQDWGRGARLPALGLIPGGSFDPEVVTRLKQAARGAGAPGLSPGERPGGRQPARPLVDAAAAFRRASSIRSGSPMGEPARKV